MTDLCPATSLSSEERTDKYQVSTVAERCITGLITLSNMIRHVPIVKSRRKKITKCLIIPQLLKHLKVDVLSLGLLYTSEH